MDFKGNSVLETVEAFDQNRDVGFLDARLDRITSRFTKKRYVPPTQEAASDQSVQIAEDVAGNACLLFATGEQLLVSGQSAEEVRRDRSLFSAGVPCFLAGTMILTPTGEVPVEMLKAGDQIVTRDNGTQEVVWSAQTHLSQEDLLERPDLRPIRIQPGGWGGERGAVVSPDHMFSVSTAEKGGTEVLVSARTLEKMKGGRVRIARGVKAATYVHIMFRKHQLVFANGIAAESFYPGTGALMGLKRESCLEVLRLVPALGRLRPEEAYGQTARSVAQIRELPSSIRDIRLDVT